MATRRTATTKAKRQKRDFVTVSNKSYGKSLIGTRIYFQGERPQNLKDDGSINFGKEILETLKKKFGKFRWIITPDVDSIETKYGTPRVRTSQHLLRMMNDENWDRSRVRRFFSIAVPLHSSTRRGPPDDDVPGKEEGK